MLEFSLSEMLLESSPNRYWKMLHQIGIKDAVGVLPRNFMDWRMSSEDKPWGYFSLKKYKNMLEDNGFNLRAIEDNPPMDKIRLNLPGKEEELNSIAEMIENFGKLNIGLWCYNWMAGIGWARSHNYVESKVGTVSSFNVNDISGYRNEKVKINRSLLWQNLKEFLDFIVPLAEDNNVKLAMHPDDPPIEEFAGIPRIMNSIESYDKLLELHNSEFNGITLCQGNFTLMTDNLPITIRHFGNKILFVHFRDVLGDKNNYIETQLGYGKTDLAGCIKAYNDINYDGLMRVDHVPTLEGDSADIPGYSYLGRLYAIGYIRGLIDSVRKI